MGAVDLQGTHRTQGRRQTRIQIGPNGISARRSVVFALRLALLSPTRLDNSTFGSGTHLPNKCVIYSEPQAYHNLFSTKFNMW